MKLLASTISTWLGSDMHLEYDREISEWVIDSRRISFADRSIFVALKGELRDGHDYVMDAFAKGVRCFLVSENITLPDSATVYHVQDTLRSMQSIAQHARQLYEGKVLSIAGSNGKTIIKEWLEYLVRDELKVYKSPKSYNSQIGVAISILEMDIQSQLAIIEAGVSQADEMKYLRDMIEPRYGILTNIGDAHQDGFQNREEKLNEKLELFANAELLITLSLSSPSLEQKLHEFINLHPVKLQEIFPSDYDITIHNHQSLLRFQNHTYTLPFIDDASIHNAILCLAAINVLDIRVENLQDKLANLPSVSMRMEFLDGIGQSKIISDVYNADLQSAKIAFATLDNQSNEWSKTVILSELDVASSIFYSATAELIQLLNQYNFGRIILVGEHWTEVMSLFDHNQNRSLLFYRSTEALIDQFDSLDFQNEYILVKGSRKFQLEKIVKLLQQKQHTVRLEVNLNHLQHNLHLYKKLVNTNTKLMVMVKALSYGAGSYEIAKQLQNWGVDYLGVAYADEGVHLRRKGIRLPIMVMNPELNALEDITNWDLEIEVYNERILNGIIQFCLHKNINNISIHIKLDTGMHRLGWHLDNLSILAQKLLEFPFLKVKSTFTHLASSDTIDGQSFVHEQIKLFQSMIVKLHSLGVSDTGLHHVLNSSGIENFPEYQFDMVRLGIGLYGYSPNTDIMNQLEVVSVLKAEISQLNYLDSGDTVGYSRAGRLTRKSTIATINIGYADGYPRSLGHGRGQVFVNGKLAPTVGNICMDMCMIDVTDIAVQEGDEVIIYGDKPDIHTVASQADTIPYEILTNISERVMRVFNWE